MPAMVMQHDEDPRQVLLAKVGDISDFEVFHNQVLCAVYQRPEKTRSGLLLADSTRDEDKTQGKVGVVLKMGGYAFRDETAKWFRDAKIELGDWVYYRASDGWALDINGVRCRILEDTTVRGRIQHPDQVW